MTSTKLQQDRIRMLSLVTSMNELVTNWEQQQQLPTNPGKEARRFWKASRAHLENLRQDVNTLLETLQNHWLQLTTSHRQNLEMMVENLQQHIVFLQEDVARFRTRYAK